MRGDRFLLMAAEFAAGVRGVKVELARSAARTTTLTPTSGGTRVRLRRHPAVLTLRVAASSILRVGQHSALRVVVARVRSTVSVPQRARH